MDVRTEADVPAAVDVDAVIITAVDATMDVIIMDVDFPGEIIIPAVISSGSSFFCVCAETTDAAMDVVTAAATATAAGSLSYCFCCAAMAADVDADNHRLLAEGPLPLPF